MLKLIGRFADIKILLISHSHFDHDAGSAELLRQTGAKYMVMDGDVSVVESGGATDFAYGNRVWIDPKGYQATVAEREQAFETELKRQQQ